MLSLPSWHRGETIWGVLILGLHSGPVANPSLSLQFEFPDTTGTLKVGIREFREKLATYLLETDETVAITRHGDTVGYYIPARRKRSDAERAALKEVASRLQDALAAEGISEEEILKDFKRWRRGEHK